MRVDGLGFRGGGFKHFRVREGRQSSNLRSLLGLLEIAFRLLRGSWAFLGRVWVWGLGLRTSLQGSRSQRLEKGHKPKLPLLSGLLPNILQLYQILL